MGEKIYLRFPKNVLTRVPVAHCVRTRERGYPSVFYFFSCSVSSSFFREKHVCSVPAISSPFSPFSPLALLIDFLRVLPLQFLLQDERRGGKKENPAAAQNRCTKTVGSQCFRTYSIGAGKKKKNLANDPRGRSGNMHRWRMHKAQGENPLTPLPPHNTTHTLLPYYFARDNYSSLHFFRQLTSFLDLFHPAAAAACWDHYPRHPFSPFPPLSFSLVKIPFAPPRGKQDVGKAAFPLIGGTDRYSVRGIKFDNQRWQKFQTN